MGDARYNMGNSLMIVCAKLGLHFTACTAKEYFPNEDLVNQCREWAKESGGSVTLTEDVTEGTKGAEVLYTDVWVSMGEPDEVWTERINALLPYQVNKKVMDNADKNAIFMHCLPAFHDLKTTIGKEFTISSDLMKWKLQMRYSSQSSQLYLMRQRTVCTQSRL